MTSLLLLLLLQVPSTPHKCDVPQPTTFSAKVNEDVYLGFCSDEPTAGSSQTGVSEVIVTLDGKPQPPVRWLDRSETRSANDQWFYTIGPMRFAAGTHTVNVQVTDVEGATSALGEAVTIAVTGTQTDPCAGKVQLALGNWPREAVPGQRGLVSFSLLRSVDAIVKIVVLVDGVPSEIDPLTGSDLRRVPGAYFRVPAAVGDHKLIVSATDSHGCEAGSANPMTMVVK